MSITMTVCDAGIQEYEFYDPAEVESSGGALPYCWPGTTREIIVVEDECIPNSTNTTMGNIPLVRLEEYASANMLKEYCQLAETIEWTNYNPEELLRVIDLALSLDLAVLAMQLAQQGRTLFPSYERMQQAGHVLTPPIVHQVKTPPDQAQSASQKWLRENAARYHGQWVAIRAGTLLGTAASLGDLMPIINEDAEPLNILVTKVL